MARAVDHLERSADAKTQPVNVGRQQAGFEQRTDQRGVALVKAGGRASAVDHAVDWVRLRHVRSAWAHQHVEAPTRSLDIDDTARQQVQRTIAASLLEDFECLGRATVAQRVPMRLHVTQESPAVNLVERMPPARGVCAQRTDPIAPVLAAGDRSLQLAPQLMYLRPQ